MSATHLYLVLQGSLSSAQLAGETWQTGVRLCTRPGITSPVTTGEFVPFDVVALSQTVTGSNYTATSNWTTEMGASDLDPVSYLIDQALPAATALIGSALFSSATQLDSILLYPIAAPNGRVEPAVPYLQGSPARLDFTATNPKGSATNPLPPQIALVTSLRTEQVGRRGRGRMYLPLQGQAASINGRVQSSTITSVSTAMKTFLEALRLNGGGPGGVWVSPVVTGAPYTTYSMINQIRLGDVWDTQRRRRAALVEAFTSTVIDPIS